MQIGSAFGRVQDSLSWFVDNYSSLAAWRATTDRLTSFEESLRRQSTTQGAEIIAGADALVARDLTLGLPNGSQLITNLSLQVQPGDSVLVKGPSGSGKTTLFRAFGGIWPFAKGRIEMPADVMCIPQNPYFPDGRLRDAVAYPEPADRYSDTEIQRALADALLPQLASRLDDEDAWTQKLSGGERQRLAIARVLLKNPRWLLADEATSALDPKAEASLYRTLLERLEKVRGGIVSIGHRPALEAFHNRRWEIEAGADGSGAAFQLREANT